jgi:hypothetical protein
MPDANAIFISYRRSDSNDVSGRIYDRLVATFGAAAVFKDVHSIPYGVDFPTYIRQQLGRCKVLLAVIGPTWLTVERQGQRRLDDPADWVRIEIQTALENEGITVIPVLVGEGDRLSEANLPDGLGPLAKLNSAQARPDPDFHIDMTRLVRRLEDIVGPGNSVEPGGQSPGQQKRTNPQREFYLKRISQLEERLAIVLQQLDAALGAEEEMALNNRAEQLSKQIESFQSKLDAP